jgi:hypothetical protein
LETLDHFGIGGWSVVAWVLAGFSFLSF